eukprot:8210268-Alexandrium_andersonii.AAC.1
MELSSAAARATRQAAWLCPRCGSAQSCSSPGVGLGGLGATVHEADTPCSALGLRVGRSEVSHRALLP